MSEAGISSVDDALDLALADGTLAADALRGLLIAGIVYSAEGRLRTFEDLVRLSRQERGRCSWTYPPAGRRRSWPEGPAWKLAARGLKARTRRSALACLDDAARRRPGDAGLVFLRALIAIKPRSSDQGISGLDAMRRGMERAAELAPGSAWAQLGLGLSLHLRQAFQEAASRYELSSRLRPGWAWPVLLRGDALQFGGRMEEGLAEFERAARLKGGSAWAGLLASRAERWRPEGRRRMIAHLNRAARGLPSWGPLLTWRAQAHRMLGHVRQARRDFARAAALDDRYDRTFAWRGDWLVERGLYAEALADLDRACRLNPHYDIPLFARARARLRLGRGREALRDLTRALAMQVRVDLEEDTHHFRSGRLCWTRALPDLVELARLFPKSAPAARYRGWLQLLAGDCEAALGSLERAAALGAADDWTFAWRGQARRRLGRPREALEDLDLALAARPRNGWALAWRSQLRSELGDEAGALADGAAAVRANPRVFAGHAAHAAALVRRGEWLAAAAALEQAYGIYPQEGWLGAWIGRLCCRAGQWERALTWVRRARNYRYDAWESDLLSRIAAPPGRAWDESAFAWEDAAGAVAAYEALDAASVLRTLDRELEFNPLDANAEAAYAARLARLGDLDGATRRLKRAEGLCPSHPALGALNLELALRLVLAGRFAEAEARARAAAAAGQDASRVEPVLERIRLGRAAPRG